MFRYLPSLLACCLLASCTSPSVFRQATDRDWRLEGKLSVQTGGKTRVANIDWLQRGMDTEILLSGPLGTQKTFVTVKGGQLTIAANGEVATYPYGQDLVVEGESFRLPWRSLAWWVRGYQGPGMVPIVGGFSDGDWQVAILKSTEDGPRLIELHHPKARLRLSVRQWLPVPDHHLG